MGAYSLRDLLKIEEYVLQSQIIERKSVKSFLLKYEVFFATNDKGRGID